MPDLFQTLRSADLDFLKRVARAWKVDLSAQDFQTALEEMKSHLMDQENLEVVIETLPERAVQAWKYLIEHKGKETWAIFTRHFGELRAFGAAKRSREEPDLHPVSATEELWYRALIGRTFLDISPEPQEYAFIPDEFFFMLAPESEEEPLQLRPASTGERKVPAMASDGILDDATDTLAALRMERGIEQNPAEYRIFVSGLLLEAGILSTPSNLNAARVKDFLAAARGKALLELYTTWLNSARLNDLRLLPGLIFEGNWTNDVTAPRRLVIDALKRSDTKTWWSLNGFISQVREKQPDFQRPAGDYDSWFIRDAVTNEHLQGTKHWGRIEGALLYFLVTGPLHWLGITDLAQGEKDGLFTAFKLSEIGVELLDGKPPAKTRAESGLVSVSSDGVLRVPVNVPRSVRYQVSRFGTPMPSGNSERKYRITPATLKQAAAQGLKTTHLVHILQQAGVRELPPVLLQQLERWEKFGSEAVVEKVTLLHLSNPALLPLLQKNSRVSQSIATVLNNQTLVIKPGKVEQLRQGLAELGLLADVKIDSDV